jgi:molybdenum cofactor synthesis domain-containing protein
MSTAAVGLASLPPHMVQAAEAYAFRRLLLHLQAHPEVQNMEAMTTTGFCRNCLAKWMLSGLREMAPLPLAAPLEYDEVACYVYGMPQKDWKKEHQRKATPEDMARYEASKPLHASHAVGAQTPVPAAPSAQPLTLPLPAAAACSAAPSSALPQEGQPLLDPCCPDPTTAVPSASPSPAAGAAAAAAAAAIAGPPPPSSSSSSSSSAGRQLPSAPLAFDDTGAAALLAALPAAGLETLCVGVLTVSDRAAAGAYADESGPAAVRCVEAFAEALEKLQRSQQRSQQQQQGGGEVGVGVGAFSPISVVVACTRVVPDDAAAIEATLREWSAQPATSPSWCNLVVTTGGTGFGPRDVTPEATARVVTKRIPGITSMVAAAAAERQPLAYLSRGIAGVVGAGAVGNQHPVVVLNTPGSPVAVTDHLRLCLPLLAHSVAAAAAGP